MDVQDYDIRSEVGFSDGSLNNEEELGEFGMLLSLFIYNNFCFNYSINFGIIVIFKN